MRYLIILLMFMAFFSCKKKTMIKVHVENVVTGAPYVDQLIYIREAPQNVNQENTTVYEGHTDSDGKLFIDFKYRRNAKYTIFIGLPEHYCYLHSLGYTIEKEKTNDIHFRLAPCAKLKFRYENLSCQGSDDYFEAYRFTNLEGYSGFTINAVYEGCANYTMPNFEEVPMGWWFFEWTVIKNGIEENFTDSVYLEEGEELLYEFTY